MATRRGERPTPLQERYYRAGLNAGAVLMLRRAYEYGIDRELALDLESYLTRLHCHGVQTSAPSLTPTHPMAAWATKKRRGR